MPRRDDEVVVIQDFFLKSRSVGSKARGDRHARLRLGDGVRDDHVEEFAHAAEIEEYVPTTWLLRKRQAGYFEKHTILGIYS